MSAGESELNLRTRAVLGEEAEYGLGVDHGARELVGLAVEVPVFERLLDLAERGQRSEKCGCHPGPEPVDEEVEPA